MTATTQKDEGTRRALKEKDFAFWNRQACGTQFSNEEIFTRAYFDDIEQHRYKMEPEVLSFAQFARFQGKEVLEVGVGAGTDFVQWVRAGAKAYGVDLTPTAVEHIERRLAVYGLKAEEIRLADCESLPYDNGSFDLVYSWGVIHHTPDTNKALEEIVRVCRSGGVCKVMVYHRYSVLAFNLWVKQALLKMRPWRSLSWCITHFIENEGTKAYSRREILAMLKYLSVREIQVKCVLTAYDEFDFAGHSMNRALRALLGNRAGWFMLIQFSKT